MLRKSISKLALRIAPLGCFLLANAAYAEAALSVPAEQVCTVADERLSESSGLAPSRRDPGLLWIHNDSGDTARLFLVGTDGVTRGMFPLADTPMPVDWEDMCSFTLDGEPWLLVGDIGDNSFFRHIATPDVGEDRACRLLLIREPVLKDGQEQDKVPVHSTIVFEYDDGPHNCESVAVDTEREEILLVTKSKTKPLDCGVYTLPLTFQTGTTTVVARRIGSLDLHNATGMDIATDNRRMVIISSQGGTLVEREANEGWGDAIKREALEFELPKRHGGETVCFGQSKDELYLNSEHALQPLWRLTIPAPAEAR